MLLNVSLDVDNEIVKSKDLRLSLYSTRLCYNFKTIVDCAPEISSVFINEIELHEGYKLLFIKLKNLEIAEINFVFATSLYFLANLPSFF